MALGERTAVEFEGLDVHLQFTTAVVAAGQDLASDPTVTESRQLGLPQRRGRHFGAALIASGASRTVCVPRARAKLPRGSDSGLLTTSDTATPVPHYHNSSGPPDQCSAANTPRVALMLAISGAGGDHAGQTGHAADPPGDSRTQGVKDAVGEENTQGEEDVGGEEGAGGANDADGDGNADGEEGSDSEEDSVSGEDSDSEEDANSDQDAGEDGADGSDEDTDDSGGDAGVDANDDPNDPDYIDEDSDNSDEDADISDEDADISDEDPTYRPRGRKVMGSLSDRSSESVESLKFKRSYSGFRPRIAFMPCSTVADNPDVRTFVREHYGRAVPSARDARCNVLVYGPRGIGAVTTNLIFALARGMWVVREEWLVASHAAGHYVAPADYAPDVPSSWELDLVGVVDRGRRGQNGVLMGMSVYLTSNLCERSKGNHFEEVLLDILRVAGAWYVTKQPPPGQVVDNGIVFGLDHGDEDEAGRLLLSGWKVFSLKLIGASVLAGQLLLIDQLRVTTRGMSAAAAG